MTAVLFAATTPSDDASACSCGPSDTPGEALAKSDAVFEATVEKIDAVPTKMDPVTARVTGGSLAHVTVLRSWKGAAARSHVLVEGGIGASMCGYPFVVGKTYVIYAYRGQESQLRTSICRRTKLSEVAQEDLKALGPGKT